MVLKKRWALTLALALMASSFLPLSMARAEEVEPETAEAADVVDEDETLVEPEVNEDSLKYLLLVDSFETAERIPTRRLSTPAEVVVVTADEIDANHYQSVSEALSHVNSIVASNGIGVGSLNGNDRILTLVDGRRSFMYPPIKAIERIEIVKGGGSALYGSDAVGGVINIITKRGDHDETTIDLNTGSWHRHRYEITNQGNDGKLGWFIDAGIATSRPYSFNGSGDYDSRTDYHDKWVTLRLDHRFDDRNSLTLDVMHDTSKNSLKWSPHQYDLHNQVALTYNFKETTSTPGFLRYFNNYTHDYTYFYDYGESRMQGIDYQNGWELGQHKFIVGGEWHQTATKADQIDFSNTTRKVTNQAYYIQDTITMGRKWTLVPGTRLDHNSQFGSQWSPKVAANYSPDDQTKIFASWGRVYQAPSARQLYTSWWHYWYEDDIPYLYEDWHGDANLRPETGHTETIGVEHDFSDKVNVSLSLFNAKIHGFLDINDNIDEYSNIHSPSNATPPNTLRWINLDYVNSSADEQRGIDLTYRQRIDKHWSYNLGYTYTHRERPLGSEEYISHWRVPKNSYKASIRYQSGPWKASLWGIMGSGSDGPYYLNDNLALLDFNISCDVSEWATVYAKAINFTNQNRHYGGRNWDGPGRMFQFGLDCRF
ncbi:MAG: TonB-dependent receptor [Selenomonadaceae bacterium]|nr:TonB-dependent receptor [Selenomonadaceae bacterium]